MALAGTEPEASWLARLAGPLRAGFGRALDVALPRLCLSCRELVGDNGLCAACWAKLA
jgi:hypothetical protein